MSGTKILCRACGFADHLWTGTSVHNATCESCNGFGLMYRYTPTDLDTRPRFLFVGTPIRVPPGHAAAFQVGEDGLMLEIVKVGQ